MFSARKCSGVFRAIRLHHFRSHSVSRSSPNVTFVPACLPPDPVEVEELQRFVSNSKRLFVMTGAGISTESGIPDYRSEGVGLYTRTDRRPVQHAEFVRSASARQRYWARNFVGWPQFSSHQPNKAHLVLRDWEKLGKLHWLVTQNVDALHTKAGSQRMTELHGCTHRYSCWHRGVGQWVTDRQLQCQLLRKEAKCPCYVPGDDTHKGGIGLGWRKRSQPSAIQSIVLKKHDPHSHLF